MNENETLSAFRSYLCQEERSQATVCQYSREVGRFLQYLGDGALTRQAVIDYKHLLEARCKSTTVNAKLSALNCYFRFLHRQELCLKLLKLQRSAFCPAQRELSRQDYLRLIQQAQKQGKTRLSLLLQTICATGIRVSELPFITVEAVAQGAAVIRLKGKTRTILLPEKLRQSLKNYIRRTKIQTGPVFVTRTGRPLDRSNIWKMMKRLCRDAAVSPKKGFPHNLRHLFARCFYDMEKDLAKLADILGHSSVNTTRIYIMSTGEEHRRTLDALSLVV